MNSRWITMLVFTIMAVVVWIALGISERKTHEETAVSYREYIVPIEPGFDSEALQEIIDRESETLLIDRDALE